MDKLRATYRIVVFIGLAIMASVVVYAVIVGLLENGTIVLTGQPMAGNELDIMKFALLGVAIAVFPLLRYLSGKIINAESPSAGSRTSGTSSEFWQLTTAAIVTFALCEVPSIFGLALYFLGRNPADFSLFMLISLFFFATNFPRFSQWEEWYRRKSGGQRLP